MNRTYSFQKALGCSATSKRTRERCKAPAVRGWTVCRFHGARGSTGALSVRMHDKLAALIALGKHLGMFDQRTQKTNVVYVISDKPMSDEEWSKRYVTPHSELSGPPGKRNEQYRHGERTMAAIAEQRKFSALLKMLCAGLT
jgi:hypothetical protein